MRLPLPLLLSTLPCCAVAAEGARTSVQLEGQLTTYRYEEPGVMRLTGSKLGVAGRVTTLQQNSFFVRGEGRLAGGSVDYESVRTGSDTGEPDYIYEIRGLAGRRFGSGETDYGWFAGIGYRYLLNDSSGHVTTTGHTGYRRESNYLYLPLGLEARKPLAENRAISFEIEYDHLLAGVQKSYLEETVTNRQRSGHGFRGGIDYHFSKAWSVGVFANYWRIGESDVVACGDVDNDGFPDACYEPENRTREAGLRLRYSIR